MIITRNNQIIELTYDELKQAYKEYSDMLDAAAFEEVYSVTEMIAKEENILLSENEMADVAMEMQGKDLNTNLFHNMVLKVLRVPTEEQAALA